MSRHNRKSACLSDRLSCAGLGQPRAASRAGENPSQSVKFNLQANSDISVLVCLTQYLEYISTKKIICCLPEIQGDWGPLASLATGRALS